MKTPILKFFLALFYIFLVLVIALFAISVASCGTPKHKTTEAVLLLDVTEPLRAWPAADELATFFDFGSGNMNGASLLVSELNDVSYNRQAAFTLPEGGNAFTTNRFDRKHEVEAFTEDIAAHLDSLTRDTLIGRPKSSLYIPLAMQLNRLAASDADTRTVIMYSDMMEHSTMLNLYDPQTLALIRIAPDTIAQILTRMTPLADLTGIELRIIYQPTDSEADDTFRLVSGFFKQYFESHGATVTIAANLNTGMHGEQ